jgi:arylsulfatase A-like enzyme
VVPGITKPGSVCHRPVDLMSVYPTLAEACGLPVPPHVEGASALKLLRDPGAEWTGVALTTHGAGNHSVRTEAWRYIRYADGGEELYDEVKDPYEWENLAGKPELAAIRADLARRLPGEDRPAPEPRRKKARKKAAGESAGGR